MNIEDLDRLEQDLSAVAGRLESQRDWKELEPRIRRTLRAPLWKFLSAAVLTAVCIGVGFWVPNAWMVAGGLLLAVLPDRVRDLRKRRRDTAEASEEDLFALYRRELQREGAGHFAHALLEAAFAILFTLVGLLASDSRPGLIAAAILAVMAVVRLFWLLPRPYRALRALDQGEAAS